MLEFGMRLVFIRRYTRAGYTLVVKALFAQIVKQLLRTVGLDH